MRGLRIWQLAAPVLAVPLLLVSIPFGCDGLNSDFVAAVLGQDGASAETATENGFVVLGYFNYTGRDGRVTYDVISDNVGATTSVNMYLFADKPTFVTWACGQYISELDLTGGEIDVYDSTTDTTTAVTISYDGGLLGGSGVTDPLECGTLIKANVRFVGTEVHIDVELIK